MGKSLEWQLCKCCTYSQLTEKLHIFLASQYLWESRSDDHAGKKKKTPVLQAVSAFSGFPEKLFSPSSLKVTSSVQLMFCATLSSDILQQLASSAMASGLAAWRHAGGGIFFFLSEEK